MVYYRKYRPQKIAELDSESVRINLTSALSAKEIAHAFLFSGPKGLGKTSAARIVAKVVNCERLVSKSLEVRSKRKKLSSQLSALSSNFEPCNRCEQCVSIANGTNLDVLEIDAASNRGIDEIRDLREKITLAPAYATKKIYIIDEVHMLTTEAFNALLKTLEEPPSHAMFILATTDPHKVPQTIQSRCFPIAFKRANEQELTRSLRRIVKGESINIDDAAMLAIAKASDGSFRDASKILEQAVISSGRRKITKEHITTIIGGIGDGFTLFTFLQEKDAKKALEWINEKASQGISIRVWLEDALSLLHQAILEKYDIQSASWRREDGKVPQFSEEELKTLIRLFSRAHQELRSAVIPQLPVEMAIIEYCIENS